MPVKEVRQMGWTRKSAGVTVLLAMEEHRKQAGARVLQLREARRWTHEDLAHAAGVSVKTVSRFEKGRNEGRRTTIRKLADALGVTEADIIGAPPAPLGLGHDVPEPDPSQLDRIEEKLDLLLSLFRPDEETAEEARAALRRLREHAADELDTETPGLPAQTQRRRDAPGS